MKVGRHTYGHEQIVIRHWGEPADLTIGSFCSIADRVMVFLGGNHRTDWVTTYPFPEFADRWETARDQDVDPYAIVAGNPAQWSDELIAANIPVLCNENVETL